MGTEPWQLALDEPATDSDLPTGFGDASSSAAALRKLPNDPAGAGGQGGVFFGPGPPIQTTKVHPLASTVARVAGGGVGTHSHPTIISATPLS